MFWVISRTTALSEVTSTFFWYFKKVKVFRKGFALALHKYSVEYLFMKKIKQFIGKNPGW